jgi:transposase
MSAPAIPAEKYQLLLDLASQGKSTRQIAEHLGTGGIRASHKTVGRVLRELRKERAEVAKAVVREELATTLTADVRRLERLVRMGFARIRKGVDNDTFCRLSDQIRKDIETKLKHSGAAEADETNMAPVIMVPPESED